MFLTSILLTAMVALAALALDFSQVTAKKNALRNVMELMALSAGYEFHMDEPNVENPMHNNGTPVITSDDTPYTSAEKVALRTALGLRAAYNIWQQAIGTKNLVPDNLVADPFGGVNWNSVLNSMRTSNPVVFPTSEYAASKVRFLTRDTTTSPLVDQGSNFPTVAQTSVFKVQGASALMQMTGSGVSTILADAVGFDKFLLQVQVVAEVVNSGPTNAVIMLIDRSLAMAVDTVVDGYYSPATTTTTPFQLDIDRHMSLTSADFTAMGSATTALQPMTRMLQAAMVVPNVLGRSNWFRDDPRRNSWLGVVAYDAVADWPFYPLDSSAEPDINDNYDGFDHSTCAGCDNENNAYKQIKNFLSSKTPVMGRASLPELDVCGVMQQQCRECYTEDCSDYSVCGQTEKNFMVPSSPRCTNSSYPYNGGAMWTYQDGVSPNPFFPWTVSDEGKGMEIAIEMIRQKRKVWINNYGFPVADFKGHIILFSDGWVNAFHDEDNVADSFPQKKWAYFTVPCDSAGLPAHYIRGGASVPTPSPGKGANILNTKPIPAGWRLSATMGNENAVAWPMYQCGWPGSGLTCPDLYHNGTQKYADRVRAGLMDPITTPSPDGVSRASTEMLSIVNVSTSSDCPANQCPAAMLEYEDYSTPPDLNRKPGFNLYCSELAFMDFVDWADANGITTHAVAFGDIKSSYNASTFNPGLGGAWNENYKRQFLLQYAADAYEDAQNKGFFVKNPNCNETGTGCSEFETALESAFVGVEVRLKK